jgi:hypothetical protein
MNANECKQLSSGWCSTNEFGWPGRMRSTGRVAKRQEAGPFGLTGRKTFALQSKHFFESFCERKK